MTDTEKDAELLFQADLTGIDLHLNQLVLYT